MSFVEQAGLDLKDPPASRMQGIRCVPPSLSFLSSSPCFPWTQHEFRAPVWAVCHLIQLSVTCQLWLLLLLDEYDCCLLFLFVLLYIMSSVCPEQFVEPRSSHAKPALSSVQALFLVLSLVLVLFCILIYSVSWDFFFVSFLPHSGNHCSLKRVIFSPQKSLGTSTLDTVRTFRLCRTTQLMV